MCCDLTYLILKELESMLEEVYSESDKKKSLTLSHFYAVAMNVLQNGTSAIAAGKLSLVLTVVRLFLIK